MKILYLQLKNFANIYTAMHRKKVEIDFSKCKNRIVLFVGKNGSGKTSILSELHPFAYSGNMDVRNNSNLILDDNDGYKEIHIQDGENIYVIKHFYKNTKRGITLKSFISKNGDELNANGNVTSFNEYVYKELSIEQDYLKLLRLGSNVTNLIEMKATERKNFTSDLLSDIDIYNQLFKKINEDNRVLKNLIKTVSDKINKLNVVDKEDLEKSITDLSSIINGLNTNKENLQIQLGNINGIISTLVPEGVDIFKTDLDKLYDNMHDYSELKMEYENELNDILIILVDTIDEYLQWVYKTKINIDTDITINTTKIAAFNDQRNELYNKKDEILNQLKYLSTSDDENKLTDMKDELTNKYNKLHKKFKDNTPEYSKDNIMMILNILQEINEIAHDIYEFNVDNIKETIRLIRESTNIERYVQKEVEKIDKKISGLGTSSVYNAVKDDVVVLYRPSACTADDCPYLYLYDRIFKSKDKSGSIESLEKERDRYIEILNINKNIDYIMVILKANRSLISKSAIKYTSIESILSHIEKQTDLYVESELTNIISYIEEYEDYIKLKGQISDIENEISKFNNNSGSIGLLQNNLSDVDIDISKIERQILELNIEIESLNDRLDVINEKISEGEKYQELTNKITELDKTISDNNNKIKEHEKTLEVISQHITNKDMVSSQINTLNTDIINKDKELFNKKVTLKEFESLSDELITLNTKFDELSVIKEALSSNKGIPLLYIQLYLKNTKIYVNDLLSAIYSNEEFEIDDVEINSAEFNIPYIKNGVRINDVVYASQGEKSFLSLALSFALITQSIDKYNILLLDELDSTLDYTNRPLFLNILEKQMNIINAEQIFLITHNDMFDSYPVDIVMTTDMSNALSGDKNIIFKV